MKAVEFLADPDRLLKPAEVAEIFHVETCTVRRWADTGKLRAVRTLGGHCRYRVGDIIAALTDTGNRVT